MISSTTSSDHAARLDPVAVSTQTAVRPTPPKPDRISTESANFLRDALAAHPEVRPEIVERARALLADPTYPSPDIIRRIGEQILGSPDLSEDLS